MKSSLVAKFVLYEFEESGKFNGVYTIYWPVQMLINNNKKKKYKKNKENMVF